MTKESRIRQLLESTPFPGAGERLGKAFVKESVVDIEGRNWEIHFEGKLNVLQVRRALKALTSHYHGVEVDGKYALVFFEGKGMSHVRTNPPGDLTVVRGHMYYARPNPTTPKVFQEEMDEMITSEPEKFFTVHKATGDKSLKEKLWSFVTYTGESYGWYKDGEIYHRRASIIMPKIKINKALEGATMFYHTHPYKDEPSLTSADDIQFYLDLHFAFGIKTFYTVMKHKMDKFTITGKKGGEAKYLRMDEEEFIDAIDGLIEIGEESSRKNVPKNTPETDHQNHVTKVMVEEFNKKYKSIASIKFTPSVKKNSAKRLARSSPLDSLMALSNPRPNPPIILEDKYVAKALEELQGLDYAFEHYGGDEYAHTMYVYWWLKHHLFPTPQHPKGRLFKLQEYGMDQDTRVKLREYLNTTVIGNYTYLDVVMLIGLYHDIAKLREKQPGAKPGHIIGAEMFRNEVAPELNLPSKLTEDIAHILESDVGRKGITDEQFLMESGHYYAAAKLMQMADVVTHHPLMFTGSARKAKAEGKIGLANGQKYKDYAMTEIVNDIRDFLDHGDVPRQNPPPRATVVRWVGNYEQAFSMPIVEVNLEEFDYRNVADKDGNFGEKQGGIGGHLFYMRFNSTTIPSIPEEKVITANLALNTGNLLITIGSPVPQDDLGKQIANDIYNEVGMQLKESYPDLVVEEPEPEMLVNPMLSKKIQLITLSGPSGVGKSTVLKFLAQNLPNASTPPTYTTRPRRPTDAQDRVHIGKEAFIEGIQRGEFVEWEKSNNGHFYGKKFKDFTGSVAIIDVTIGGKRKYEKSFPNMFSIFLEPDPNVSVAQRAKKLYQRGGMSKEEAKKRASISKSMVEASKKMDFDLRMVMKHGDYEKNAERILGEIPLNNPDLKDFGFDPGETPEEQEEREARLAAEKQRIAEEEEAERQRIAEREEKFVQSTLPTEEEEVEKNPKSLFEWFYDWVHLVNMKNKELKAFLDSDWGKVAGLSQREAKKLGIRRGRDSGRHILKMRKKLGLTGPKDYIKLGPRIIEDYYEKALNNWNEGDWEWCKHQVKFNNRFKGDPFSTGEGTTSGKPKGHLVKKQKTQNQPSPRLLALWVWGHDPWRYARKVEKRAKMPKCPDVPWVGMTEKRKYGKIPVIMSPRARSNPVFKKKRECPPPQKRGITIYGAEWCHWCGEAKKYLDKQGTEYKYVDIDKVKNYQKVIYPLTKNYPYVPVIFIDGKFIGGYSELTTQENPPIMVSAKDPEKWERRYNTITTGTIDELKDMLHQRQDELKLDYDVKITDQEWELVDSDNSPISKKIQNDLIEWANNTLPVVTLVIKKGDKAITRKSSVLVTHRLPRHIYDYLYDKKTTKPRGVNLASNNGWLDLGRFRKSSKKVYFEESYKLGIIMRQAESRFPFTLTMGGGGMKEILKGRGYYGLLKLLDAYVLELMGWEDYSTGTSPMRTDMYQSYGWLNAFSYMDNAPYFSEASRYYLDVTRKEVTKRANYSYIWRPVYLPRANPHYTPPPGIAMFPGEMPMGPAALYQQTVSISQLQGLQRVSPSVLANGRNRNYRKQLLKQARRFRDQTRSSNFCNKSGGKRIFPSKEAANAHFKDERDRNASLPDMHGYGPCQYCGKYHLTKSVRRNPGVFEIASLIYEFFTARKRKKSHKELETRLESVEDAMAELEALINADLIDENTVKDMLDKEVPKEVQALILEDLKKRRGESSARVSPGEPPKFYLLATGVTEHEMEAERITKRLEIHPDKPIRIGLFVGAFGHERHVAEMCQELEVAYVVDPMNFDAEIVERTVTAGLGRRPTKVYHAQMSLTEFLNMYEFTSTGDPFSLVHFPHRPSSPEEYRGVGIAKQLNSEIPRILGHCSKATLFAGEINRSLLHEGHVYIAQPVTDYDKKMKEWWKNYKPPPPSKTTPPTTESEGVDLDDLFEEVSAPTIPEQPVFTNSEWISGVKSEREVHTKVLKISGLKNAISGFVSDRLEVTGMGNIVDVTIMPSTKVEDSGMRNTIKTKVVEKSEFYKTTRRNPRTKKGRKFPKKYLKNLTPTEKAIAMYEIDRGYEYDEDDPEAYKFWESDIKSKARGLKTVPSKWRNKFAKKYGPLKEGKDFLTRISKTTGIKRAILKKIYDKGLAAWRVGHRPGVQQHQWAAGRVYAFVMGADSSTGPGKPDHKLAVEAGVR